MNDQLLNVVAFSLKKRAGVTHARVDYPLRALNQRVNVQCYFDDEKIELPVDLTPGVFILHRNFLNSPALIQAMEKLIAKGWVVVSDVDDDPHHWKEFKDNHFFAYRGVHAVTVSTEPLAKIIAQWNPNVQVFHNGIFEVPQWHSYSTPKSPTEISIFFGAFNRTPEWQAIYPAILKLDQEFSNIHWIFVHDKAAYDSLPENCKKTYYPILTHDEYFKVLEGCDIALLPLNDNPFNRLKSDLKLIECAACGVVPVCSDVVYGTIKTNEPIALLARTVDEWYHAIKRLIQDPVQMRRIKMNGLNYVKSQRMHDQQASLREAYYRQLLNNQKQLEFQRQQRIK